MIMLYILFNILDDRIFDFSEMRDSIKLDTILKFCKYGDINNI